MLAFVKEGRDSPPVLRECPVPSPGPDEALIRVRRSFICGTDLLVYQGSLDETVYPLILGHNFAGDVVEVGERVSEVKVGDRVTGSAVQSCGKCYFCKLGDWNLCSEFKHLGIHRDGCFAEYVSIPASLVSVIPGEEVSYETAAMSGPVSLVYHGICRVAIRPGDTVVITGPGAIGIIAAQLVKLSGAIPILTGLGVDEQRLRVAASIGIEGVNVEETDLAEFVRGRTGGRGADVVVETSGAPIVNGLLSILRNGGQLLLIGYSPKPQQIETLSVVMGELTIKGSSGYNWRSWLRGIELLNNPGLDLDCLVSHRFKLKDIRSGFEALRERSALRVLIDHDR